MYYIQIIRGAWGATDERKGNREMNIRKSYENWREYRKTVNELNALSTRELSDLGINRHDIRAIARSSRL